VSAVRAEVAGGRATYPQRLNTRPLVTATLIVREEAGRAGPVPRVNPGFVDEIVVVDTGSVDESPTIAAAFGARVVTIAGGMIPEARNVSLDESQRPWILYIALTRGWSSADDPTSRHSQRCVTGGIPRVAQAKARQHAVSGVPALAQ